MRFIIVFLWLLPTYALCSDIPTLRVSAAHWPNVTDKDGGGAYFKVIDKIFLTRDYKVEKNFVPLLRGIRQVADGEADMFLAVSPESLLNNSNKGFIGEFLYFPTEPIDVVEIVATYKNDQRSNWQNIKDNQQLQVAWTIGYGFDEILKLPEAKSIQVKNTLQGIRLLLVGRVAAYLEDERYLKSMLATEDFKGLELRFERVERLYVYPVFRKTDRGKRLADIYDEDVAKLKTSGELELIFKQEGY